MCNLTWHREIPLEKLLAVLYFLPPHVSLISFLLMIHLGHREEIRHGTFWMMNQGKAADSQSFPRFSAKLFSLLVYDGLWMCTGSEGGGRFSAWVCSCRHIIHVNKWLLRLSECCWRENRPDRDGNGNFCARQREGGAGGWKEGMQWRLFIFIVSFRFGRCLWIDLQICILLVTLRSHYITTAHSGNRLQQKSLVNIKGASVGWEDKADD